MLHKRKAKSIIEKRDILSECEEGFGCKIQWREIDLDQNMLAAGFLLEQDLFCQNGTIDGQKLCKGLKAQRDYYVGTISSAFAYVHPRMSEEARQNLRLNLHPVCYFPTILNALMGYAPSLFEHEPYIFAISIPWQIDHASEHIGDSYKVSQHTLFLAEVALQLQAPSAPQGKQPSGGPILGPLVESLRKSGFLDELLSSEQWAEVDTKPA